MPQNLKIKNLELKGWAMLAPMSGLTNSPMRRTAARMGAVAVHTEFVSAEGMIKARGEGRLYFFRLLAAHPEERPLAVQLFGSDPQYVAPAAAMIAETDADIINLNMGCPVRKIVRRGEGAALMKDLPRATLMVRETRKAVDNVPLTVKMRSGFDAAHINAPELCRICEGEGADAIIVHGRTKEQAYTGKADWNIIKTCVESVKIPVIGNGDVKTGPDAYRMVAETGCAGVMVARAALGNPWIFRSIMNPDAPLPDLREKKEMILWHYRMLTETLDNFEATAHIRKHLIWYSKGLPGGIELRRSLGKIRTRAQVLEAINRFFTQEKAILPVSEMGD